MIDKKVEQKPEKKPIKQIIRGKGGKAQEAQFQKTNQMQANEEVYEFKKTARHEAVDARTNGLWDEFGRFFVVCGNNKGPGVYGKGKTPTHIKIYSIFGEPLLTIDRLVDF